MLKELLNKEFEVVYDGIRKGKTCGYVTKFEDGYTHNYIKVKFSDIAIVDIKQGYCRPSIKKYYIKDFCNFQQAVKEFLSVLTRFSIHDIIF